MLVIKPEEYIDCAVYEPECPVDAFKLDIESGIEKWLKTNKKYFEIWPNINQKKNSPADADNYRNIKKNMRNILKKI